MTQFYKELLEKHIQFCIEDNTSDPDSLMSEESLQNCRDIIRATREGKITRKEMEDARMKIMIKTREW